MKFKLKSNYQPTGDQPKAIEKLVAGLKANNQRQVLLGVTGSGKTFTMANVIVQTQKPTLVIAHNKTLAAQLYQEFRDFFPDNAVSYFVSYYDYYQPEAYIPRTDTYIEKEATINEDIDRLRLATTTNLLTRPDAIVVASVSCIYNLGSPVEYGKYLLRLMEGEIIPRKSILLQLENLQYERSDHDLKRGSYRLSGEVIQVWPAYEEKALKIETLENKITKIHWIDPVSGQNLNQPASIGYEYVIYPAKHYVVDPVAQHQALATIRQDLQKRLKELKDQGRLVEEVRLQQKVEYDLEMIEQFGFTGGIENYSRYFDGRNPGEPPFTLLDYFAANAAKFNTGPFLTIVDESHMTLPQIKGMHRGDQSRKETLIKHGFRLPSALDNRPLKYQEFLDRVPQLVCVSATPAELELNLSGGQLTEQLIRPTGLLDPTIELKPEEGQIEDLIIEILKRKQVGERVLVTTLTKRMSEALTEYLNDEKKLFKVIKNYYQIKENNDAAEDPNKTLWQSEELPIDQMSIGPIAQKYYRHLSNQENRFQKFEQISLADSAELQLPKVAYLHSDIETLDRSDILANLRRGEFDVLVGINLLREGLDLPEVSLVAILDADKEGFLRSTTALVQTMGRAAIHEAGRAVMYASRLTGSMKQAIGETQRRRQIQKDFNQAHQLQPHSIIKPIRDDLITNRKKKEEAKKNQKTLVRLSDREIIDLEKLDPAAYTPEEKLRLSKKIRQKMHQAAKELNFELAAQLRDFARQL